MSRSHYRRWRTDPVLRQRFTYMYTHPEFYTLRDIASAFDISISRVLTLRKMYGLPRRLDSPKFDRPFRHYVTTPSQ